MGGRSRGWGSGTPPVISVSAKADPGNDATHIKSIGFQFKGAPLRSPGVPGVTEPGGAFAHRSMSRDTDQSAEGAMPAKRSDATEGGQGHSGFYDADHTVIYS